MTASKAGLRVKDSIQNYLVHCFVSSPSPLIYFDQARHCKRKRPFQFVVRKGVDRGLFLLKKSQKLPSPPSGPGAAEPELGTPLVAALPWASVGTEKDVAIISAIP